MKHSIQWTNSDLEILAQRLVSKCFLSRSVLEFDTLFIKLTLGINWQDKLIQFLQKALLSFVGLQVC